MNLDEIDHEVRDSLLMHADDAPSGVGTLEAVRTRSQRLKARRRAGLAGVAALVAVAAAVGTPYALTATGTARTTAGAGGLTGSTVTPATSAATQAATNPATLPDRRSRVQLVTTPIPPVVFPMTPSFVPAGLPAPTEHRTVGMVDLIYAPATGDKVLTASVTAQAPGVDFTPRTTTQITVSGHPATLYVGAPNVEIVWKLHGKFVSVYGTDLSTADVERYANGLADHPGPAHPLPFTMALTPHGYVVDFQEIHPELTPTELYFNMSPRSQINNQLSDDMLGVISYPDLSKDLTGIPITVGGYPGRIKRDGDFIDVLVLRPGFVYEVHESDKGPLSNADLIRFAAGVAPR